MLCATELDSVWNWRRSLDPPGDCLRLAQKAQMRVAGCKDAIGGRPARKFLNHGAQQRHRFVEVPIETMSNADSGDVAACGAIALFSVNRQGIESASNPLCASAIRVRQQ